MTKRDDLQILRCIAIISVLLYHLWPQTFSNGYLGVDMFFTLSGYLMCSILSPKPMNSSTISTFYFRRLKRILPAHLTIVLCTVISGYISFPSSAYSKLLKQSLSAVTLTSNVFNLPKTGYSADNDGYNLFLHTWSLSVEVQFYFICPLVIICLNWARSRNKNCGIAILLLMIMTSFLYQCWFRDDPNTSHMSLISRIWQFLFGFFAFTLTSATENGPSLSLGSLSNQRALKNNLVISIILIGMTNLPFGIELMRLLCAIVTTLFIIIDVSTVSSSFLVHIGDVSYSTYLVHWTLLRLLDCENLSAGLSMIGRVKPYVLLMITMTIIESLAILFASLQLGTIVEAIFIKISSWIISWKRLLFLTSLLFLSTTLLQAFIFLNLPSEEDGLDNCVLSYRNPRYLRSIKQNFQNLSQPMNLTPWQQVLMHNHMSHYIEAYVPTCKKKYIKQYGESSVTENFKYICKETGSGTKEVVIIGNSIARDLFFGINDQWRHFYKTLSVIANPNDVPFMKEETNRSEEILDILRHWERPIDVLLVQHSYKYDKFTPEYISTRMKYEMETFYDEVSRLVKEAILIGYPGLLANANINTQTISTVLEKKLPYTSLDFDRMQEDRTGPIRRVIDTIHCPKCVFVDFSKPLCPEANSRCPVILPNSFTLYRDRIHTTLYGSFLVGQEFIQSYHRRFEEK